MKLIKVSFKESALKNVGHCQEGGQTAHELGGDGAAPLGYFEE